MHCDITTFTKTKTLLHLYKMVSACRSSFVRFLFAVLVMIWMRLKSMSK